MRTGISHTKMLFWLRGLTTVSLLVAAGFWVWNPEPSTPSRKSNPDSSSSPKTSVAALPQSGTDNQSIIAANIFSASRTSPRQRYNPANDELDSIGEVAAPAMADVSPPPLLFGTVLGPAGAMALMQADGAAGPGRMYREGEKIGSYRLLKVKANSVILGGPTGRMEIQVQRGSPGAP